MACGEPDLTVSNCTTSNTTGGIVVNGNQWHLSQELYPGVMHGCVSTNIVFKNDLFEREDRLALYKVYLIHKRTRDIKEFNVVAESETDAYLIAFMDMTGVMSHESKDYDKHAEHICDLAEDNE